MLLTDAEHTAAVVEIERRAAAIRRNTEAALLDELPTDAVLLASTTLAAHIERWTRAMR